MRGGFIPNLENARLKATASDCPTGIPELDESMRGGIPRNSITLIAGSPGSGKTVLSMQWLFAGAAQGENGVYITNTESPGKIIQNLKTLSFYAPDLAEKVEVIDLREVAMVPTDSIEAGKVIEIIAEKIASTNSKRLCLDSITSIASNLGGKSKIRDFIYHLGKAMAKQGCTIVLISETLGGG